MYGSASDWVLCFNRHRSTSKPLGPGCAALSSLRDGRGQGRGEGTPPPVAEVDSAQPPTTFPSPSHPPMAALASSVSPTSRLARRSSRTDIRLPRFAPVFCLRLGTLRLRCTLTTRTRPPRRLVPLRPPRRSPRGSLPTADAKAGVRASLRTLGTEGRTQSVRSPSTHSTSDARRSVSFPPFPPGIGHGSHAAWDPHPKLDTHPQTSLSLGCQASGGNTIALQVDSDGNVNYGAIAQQGQRDGKLIQSSYKGPSTSPCFPLNYWTVCRRLR